jgi:hypothetical protein
MVDGVVQAMQALCFDVMRRPIGLSALHYATLRVSAAPKRKTRGELNDLANGSSTQQRDSGLCLPRGKNEAARTRKRV